MDDNPGFWVKFKAVEGLEMPDAPACKILTLPNIGDIVSFPRWSPGVRYVVETVEHDILEKEGPNDIFIVLRKA